MSVRIARLETGNTGLRPHRLVPAVLCALSLLASTLTWAQVPVPPLQSLVTDLAAVLTEAQRSRLEALLRDLERRKGSQVAVLLVPTTEPEAIEQFGIRVAEAWKLGRKGVDDGAILLVALRDRTLRIEVGYGLEGALTDALAKRIISEVILPRFKNGDLAGGLQAGVEAILKVVEGEPLPPPKSERGGRGYQEGGNFEQALGLFFVIIFALSRVWHAVFGRLLGSGFAGGVLGFLLWVLTGSVLLTVAGSVIGFIVLLASKGAHFNAGHLGRRGGFGAFPGGFGGGGFGGGGFGGGFGGGGGGGFGGGGASGRW